MQFTESVRGYHLVSSLMVVALTAGCHLYRPGEAASGDSSDTSQPRDAADSVVSDAVDAEPDGPGDADGGDDPSDADATDDADGGIAHPDCQTPRCSEDPADFNDWGPALIVTRMNFEGCVGSNAGPPCGLGELLVSLHGEGYLRYPTRQILDGEWLSIWEFPGWDDPANDGPSQGFVYEGRPDLPESLSFADLENPGCKITEEECEIDVQEGKVFDIEPGSLRRGVQSRHVLRKLDDRLDGSGNRSVEGHLDSLSIPFDLLGTRRSADLPLYDVRVELVDELGQQGAGDSPGVVSGTLTGLIRVRDVTAQLKELMPGCPCAVPDAGPLFHSPQTPPDEPDWCSGGKPGSCRLGCTEAFASGIEMCLPDDDCRLTGKICDISREIVELPEVSLDEDDEFVDSMPFQVSFEAVPAEIDEVAASLRVLDQELGGQNDRVEVARAFVNEPGFVVIERSQSPLGATSLSTGWNRNIQVSLEEELAGETQLEAVLYRDSDGSGSFNGGGDRGVGDGRGNTISESFEVFAP